jgi:putative hydrolase of the HAD superfamily
MLDLVAFDADDTLWHNEGFYTTAKERFMEILAKYHPPTYVEDQLDDIEIRNLEIYGYGIKSFLLSMIETAAVTSQGRVSGREIQEILAVGKDMLKSKVPLMDGVEVILETLVGEYPLMLITKGDLFEQERKVKRSGLGKYFSYVEVVGEKTPTTYRVLLEKLDVDPTRFVMVGNSLKSDILPVLEIGGKAIYIPYHNTWAHENDVGDSLDGHDYFTIEGLGELPPLLAKLQEPDNNS